MITIEDVRKMIQTCNETAETLPEPYRSQALSIIGKKQNWTIKFEKILNQVIKDTEAAK